jgi:hypothetical protein
MDKIMANCERFGVNPKWPKYKAVIARLQKERQLAFDMMDTNIREYISREDAGPSKLVANDINITSSEPESLGRFKVDGVLALAPDKLQWLDDLSHWARYYQVGIGQGFFWHHQFRILFPNNRQGGLRMLSMEYASQMMGVMALLGWKDATLYQGYLTHAALNRNYKLELEYEEEHRRAQSFMLRLFADWVGDASHRWPAYAYDQPIYEALIHNWRSPDLQDLVPCLLAVCDRHTWQTAKDTTKDFYDFHNVGLTRTPIEVLFVFRLREWEGLTNPVLDHPLMAVPFNQLPPMQVVPEFDELMQGVLKRARADWPQYDTVLSLEVLKQAAQG